MEEQVKKSKNVPDFIKNKPILREGLVFYWTSYWLLSSERFSEGAEIPWSAIINFAQYYGLCVAEQDLFVYTIMSLDKFHLNAIRDKHGKQLDSSKQ